MRAQCKSHIVTFPWLRVDYLMNRVSAPGAPSIDRLQVLVQSRSITASKSISKLARSRPPSASPISLQYGLQARMIMASKCMSKLAPSLPQSASPSSLDHILQVYQLTCSITPSNCISKLARSQPPSVCRNSLDYGLQVHLPTHSITALGISEFTRSLFSLAPRIALKHRQQPVQIYCV